MITFHAPWWLLLLAGVLALLFRPKCRRHPLRLLCLGLLALLLAGPQIQRWGRGMDVWVLEDQSASAAEGMATHRAEIEALLDRSRGSQDRLFFVDYASLAQLRSEADSLTPDQKQQTRTALAVQFALTRLKPDRTARLLLVTDGFSTEPLVGLTERLARQQVALDYRLLVRSDQADYRVAQLDLPTRIQTGEPFLLEAEIAGPGEGSVDVQVRRDGVAIGRSTVKLQNGSALIRFTDRLTQSGAHSYTVHLPEAADALPENNHLEKWIEVKGGPAILLLTAYADDPIIGPLRAQGFEVRMVTDPGRVTVGQLSGARAVILNNVAAFQLPTEFLHALDFYVRSQGGGLLMAGGKFSFGSGGYFESPIDSLLPVSLELRTEERKLAVAMSVVLDRSGSMSAAVGPNLEKMDLANEGAARSIELLGSMDAVSVFAVDTQAHEIVPLTTLGKNRDALDDVVRRITSGGGGICVPTGLRAAWNSLKESRAGQRHVVLFADANDATQELGDYQTLLSDMIKDGITVSVIGLGKKTDSGGEFLEEVAKLGKGRLFFSENPNDLPAIFAQETIAVARSAFLEEPVEVDPTGGWLSIASEPMDWLPSVDGYNLSYLRPEATAAAITKDQEKAPLVAYWQRGAGRVAAVSFPLGGGFSRKVREWPRYPDFIQTLNRWLTGDPLPPGLALQTRLNGSRLQLDLYYDQTWENRLAQRPPQILLAAGDSTEPQELIWERLSPGHYSATSDLQPNQLVRGVVQVDEFTLPFGPLLAGSSIEWAFDPTRLNELKRVSRTSGGTERLDLAAIWKSESRESAFDLTHLLLSLLLAIFVIEAYGNRLGWKIRRSN